MKVKVAQSCPTLCDPMDCTVHGILQARILEWEAHSIPNPGIEPRSPALQADLYQLSHKGSPRILEWVAYPFSSRSSQPRNQTDPGIKPGSPALQVDSFPEELACINPNLPIRPTLLFPLLFVGFSTPSLLLFFTFYSPRGSFLSLYIYIHFYTILPSVSSTVGPASSPVSSSFWHKRDHLFLPSLGKIST